MIDAVYFGDSCELMDRMPEQYVDMAFCSCPIIEDVPEFNQYTKTWLKSLRRVLKDTGTIWLTSPSPTIFRAGAILYEEGWNFLNVITWVKINPPPNFHNKRNFCNATETLIWASKSLDYKFNYSELKAGNEEAQMRSDWYFPVCHQKEICLSLDKKKIDSNQKPEALLHQVIVSSTRADDIVLSPFMGAGTTLAVAKKLGRHYIGISENESVVEAASRRLLNTTIGEGNITEVPLIGTMKEKISFMDLITGGYIKPGSKLYLHTPRGNLTEHMATVLSDGTLECGKLRGSIHTLAHQILQTNKINGWQSWARLIPEGRMVMIDEIQNKYLNEKYRKDTI